MLSKKIQQPILNNLTEILRDKKFAYLSSLAECTELIQWRQTKSLSSLLEHLDATTALSEVA